ncbi:hypothetical protein BV898_09232 [Hypsibius exemplaris]|uniref:Uncharacterized protein n=1 Tax=Hypsibius exemplaris TaxID=2072580 RepID=A0A1W0WN20_HYPEX|nr:hypothetical protein BV898_09232 [Hypsibius exemplaris]
MDIDVISPQSLLCALTGYGRPANGKSSQQPSRKAKTVHVLQLSLSLAFLLAATSVTLWSLSDVIGRIFHFTKTSQPLLSSPSSTTSGLARIHYVERSCCRVRCQPLRLVLPSIRPFTKLLNFLPNRNRITTRRTPSIIMDPVFS